MKTGKTERRTGNRGRIAGLTLFVWVGLSLDLKDPGQSNLLLNLLASLHSLDMLRMLLIPGLYFFFAWAHRTARDVGRRSRLAAACFFALNMVLGEAFELEGSWNMLLGIQNGQLLKAAAVWVSWSLVFDHLLGGLFSLLDRTQAVTQGAERPRNAGWGGRLLNRYGRLLQKHPFLTPFLTMTAVFAPHFLIAYPAMFMGDTWSMIVQGYSELGTTGVNYLPPESVMRAGVFINQHHPVMYTWLLHLFLQIGDGLFHSLNAGIFLLCLGQATVMTASLAYAVSTLSGKKVRLQILMMLVLYVSIHPQIRNFLMMATKDGLYTACFILFMAAMFRIRTWEGSRKTRIIFLLAALGMILLRNEGKYVLIGSGLLTALVNRKARKEAFCFATAVLAVSLAIFRGLFPALGYTRGGTQEVLSIPLQQTARVVRDHPGDISESERAAIDAVLEYDRLASSYVPNGADPVKDLFRQDATGQEVFDYLRTWAGLALRHPDTCLQAFYANYYQYLYPEKVQIRYDSYGWSAWMCEYANDRMEPLGKAFSLPEWNKSLRYISDSLVDAGLFNLPPFSLLMIPALYSWLLISLLCRAVRKRGNAFRAEQLSLMIPSLLTFLVLFAGPTNAYYSRYMLPLTSFLPFMTVMLKVIREDHAASGA